MTARSLGDILREWRRRRHLSQLDLALDAEISQRHLSFIESGRAAPSRDLLLHLTERLGVPLRERNPILIAAGYAPVFAQRPLDDPALVAARQAIDLILKGHEPFPALAVDRHWTLVSANAALGPLLAGVEDERLLAPPVNVLRLSLHPDGLAHRIVNLAEWRNHLLERLQQQIAASGDPILRALLDELTTLPVPPAPRRAKASVPRDLGDVAVPLEIETEAGVLSFLSMTTVFGTPLDITLSELAIESFFPANAETTAILMSMPRSSGERS
jgi:transcriptional regulator with XRE-family HTH domain